MGIIAIVMNFVLESRKRNLLIRIIGSLGSDGGEDKLYILRMLAIPFVLLNDSFFCSSLIVLQETMKKYSKITL